MKKITLLFTFIFCFIFSNAFSQKKYYKNGKGVIVDEETYLANKTKTLEKIQAKFPNATIEEDNEEIKTTKDSIIYLNRIKVNMKAGDASLKDNTTMAGAMTMNPNQKLMGKEFPLTSLKTLDGKDLKLADLKGKPTLINFWFAACKPCIEEMPALNQIKKNLGDKVNFVSVTFESEKKVQEFLKKHNFDFQHIPNAREFTTELGIMAYPLNVFLDKDGKVARMENGIPYKYDKEDKENPKMGDGAEFERILKKLL